MSINSIARTKQNRMVMERLLHSNGISKKDADELGIARLASRICDLRKAGMVITKKMKPFYRPDGSLTKYAFYQSKDYEFEAKFGRECSLDGQVCHRQGSCYSCNAWKSENWTYEDGECYG